MHDFFIEWIKNFKLEYCILLKIQILFVEVENFIYCIKSKTYKVNLKNVLEFFLLFLINIRGLLVY